MFESGVGLSTSVSRQCCGIGCGGGPDCCAGATVAGAVAGLNNPAATSTALVIVARSSSIFLSSAHGMFRAPDAAKTTIANMFPPCGRLLPTCRSLQTVRLIIGAVLRRGQARPAGTSAQAAGGDVDAVEPRAVLAREHAQVAAPPFEPGRR